MGLGNEVRASWKFQKKILRRAGVATDLTSGAAYNIFAVQGAPVLITQIFGHVTTVIGAGAAVPRVQFTPTGGAQVPMAAAMASIATDAVDSVYCWDGITASTPAPSAGLGFADAATACWCAAAAGGGFFICVPGIIAITNAVASSGIVDWYICYVPCRENSRVVVL